MSNLKIVNDLNTLHPFARTQAKKVLKDCKKENLNVEVFETIRTLDRQKWLKAKGKSQTLNSYHRLGLAVDFVFKTDGGNWTWNRPNEDWDKLAEIVESHGFKSGWNWKRFRDGPHAQIQFEGLRSTSLYKKLDELNNNVEEFYQYVDGLLAKDIYLSEFLPKKIEPKIVEPEIKPVELPEELLGLTPKVGFIAAIIQFILSLFGVKK